MLCISRGTRNIEDFSKSTILKKLLYSYFYIIKHKGKKQRKPK